MKCPMCNEKLVLIKDMYYICPRCTEPTKIITVFEKKKGDKK